MTEKKKCNECMAWAGGLCFEWVRNSDGDIIQNNETSSAGTPTERPGYSPVCASFIEYAERLKAK